MHRPNPRAAAVPPCPPRRSVSGTGRAALLLAAAVLAAAPAAAEDLHARVVGIARDLATRPYAEPDRQVLAVLADLNDARYHDIQYRPAQPLWPDDRLFGVRLFPRGFLFRDRVRINIVADGRIREVPFARGDFDYGETGVKTDDVPENLGFAGFRLVYPINQEDRDDEVMVFLGASYFRLLGRDQTYGISARGLAVDTALPRGEEFPVFREFWLEQPEPAANGLTVHALLDSRSVTGAYRFEVHPGDPTTVDVQATVFARADVERFGLAPLTSMFLHGENSAGRRDDWRPEVHDSDGLLVRTGGGEWVWRPLNNPARLSVTSFLDDGIQGFGLVQRDRAFTSYLDLHGGYERRPGLWVEPRGDAWGKGAIHLVEIPTRSETNDNIVAYWVPEQPVRAGSELGFAYRLATLAEGPPHDLGRVVRTLHGPAAGPGANGGPPPAVRRFVVDFDGPGMARLRADQPVTAHVATLSGTVAAAEATKLPDGGWRATFRVEPDGDRPADMRLFLELRGRRLTETWSYVWSPHDIE